MATFDSVVDANSQATFEYKFRPSERFEPRELGLVLRIFYAGALTVRKAAKPLDFLALLLIYLCRPRYTLDVEEAQFADTAFNETISVRRNDGMLHRDALAKPQLL
jgi:hypothetical protein